jgi:hypothetical protein
LVLLVVGGVLDGVDARYDRVSMAMVQGEGGGRVMWFILQAKNTVGDAGDGYAALKLPLWMKLPGLDDWFGWHWPAYLMLIIALVIFVFVGIDRRLGKGRIGKSEGKDIV